MQFICLCASQVGLVVKIWPAAAGDVRDAGSVPESGRSPGGGRGSPLQYSGLENLMDRGAWRAAVRGVSQVRHDWSDLARMHASVDVSLIPSGLWVPQFTELHLTSCSSVHPSYVVAPGRWLALSKSWRNLLSGDLFWLNFMHCSKI